MTYGINRTLLKDSIHVVSIAVLILATFLAYGCGSVTEQSQRTSQISEDGSFSASVPVRLAKYFSKDTTLTADVTVDGGNPFHLTLDTINNVFTGTLSKIEEGTHAFEISYYISRSNQKVKVASARTKSAVTSGTTTPVNLSSIRYLDIDVSGGTFFTMALRADGTVRVWGKNDSGQLGNSTPGDSITPVILSGIDTATSVSAGDSHACAVLSDGVVKCWGNNDNGQLGDGTIINKSSPVSVKDITTARSVSTGSIHTCALLSDGSLKCWGDNESGQLGNNSTTDSKTPVNVSGVTGAKDISSGRKHNCVILGDGTVKCWGSNTNGQLGDGTTDNKKTPVDVSGITTAKNIATGGLHTCVIPGDGTVKCWGDNTKGQLGDDTIIAKKTPVTVKGITNAVSLSAGDSHTCATLSDGVVKCWGFNESGRLGNGDTVNSLVPVITIGLSDAKLVAAGDSHSCSLLEDGAVKCWGDNVNGQIGDGTNDDRKSPVNVVGLAAVVPENVTASEANAKITISWAPVSTATSYNIYRSTSPAVTKVGGTKITNITSPYTDTGLTNGKTYYYVLTSVNDKISDESAESEEVSKTTNMTYKWASQLGTASADSGKGIAVDSSGKVYVTGDTKGNLDSHTNAGDNDLFVIKYDSKGVKLGSDQFGTSEQEYISGISVDNSGNTYVTGFTCGGLYDVTKDAGVCDLFVVKYDPTIKRVWTWQPITPSTDSGTGVSVDSSGSVYVTGITFGSWEGHANAGDWDLFVSKYDPTGKTIIWSDQIGTAKEDSSTGIILDSSRNVYVTGFTSGDMKGTNSGGKDIFVLKYDSTGKKVWTVQLGTSKDDGANGIAVDISGNVYVTGYTESALDGTSAGGKDIFVAKYDTTGKKLWVRQLGTVGTDSGTGISLDTSANVYVTGYTNGVLEGYSNAGGYDLLVVKYDSSGNKLWAKQLGTAKDDYSAGISLDSSGNVYVTGKTLGAWEGNINAGDFDVFVVNVAVP